MSNRFVSWLERVGHDFKKGLDPVLKIAETAGEVAVAIYAPGLGPIFNQTVHAVATAEQNAVAIGQAQGTGPQKLASVVSLMGGLIKQALADLGKQADDAAVEKYVSSVVTILNAVPAPAPVDASATAPVSAPVNMPSAPAPPASPRPASAIFGR